MTEQDVPQKIYQICARNIKEPFRLFLFGSRASGQNSPTSDFDFYIRGKNISPKAIDGIQTEIEALDTLYKIDLFAWQDAPEDLKKAIQLGPVLEIHNE